jgi:hypothetical protein
MKTHPDGDRSFIRPPMFGECALSGDCGCDGITCTGEGDEEGIALRIDLGTAVLGKCGAKQSAMLGEDRAVALLQPLDQLCRAVDVGKEKRDGSIGQIRHHRRIFTARP